MTTADPSLKPACPDSQTLMTRAHDQALTIPAFNIPYLPMMPPVVEALRDTRTVGFIAVARLEWMKFEAGGIDAIHATYVDCADPRFTRLHLDHVPVIDEDNLPVDYAAIIDEALDQGYDSVMVDGSRLSLDDNIAATRRVVDRAHAAGRPVEAELGAVLGHEAGPLPPYETLWKTRQGFTDPEQAVRFVKETGVDWLSVSIGNVHGAISGAARHAAKIEARLHIPHLQSLDKALGHRIPLVLHGGSGIQHESIQDGIRHGISKINVGTTLRQAYEKHRERDANDAYQAVYDAACDVIDNDLNVAGSADRLMHDSGVA